MELVMISALIIRLIAAIFSRGYGMHDDHFLVIEPAQAWVDGVDYNGWLPMFKAGAVPSGHSLFYPGLHYLLFFFMKWIGLADPQTKMLIIRMLHAVFSLLTVYLGFRITEKLSDRRTAAHTGLILALAWFMPFFAIRNLVESFCIPFLMYGVWLTITAKGQRRQAWLFFLSGFLLGLAFSVRFQTTTFTAGLMLVLLVKREWRAFLLQLAGFLVSVVLIQGGIDLIIWGTPFAEFREYVLYNMTHASNYIVNVWYTYLLLLLGVLIPPVSVFLILGFLFRWRKNPEIFLPALLFFVFHSFFPNKQERFIIPVIPFLIILGMVGWSAFTSGSAFWKKNLSLSRASWIFFWIVNLVLLIPVSTMYSKRARVESMTYLSKYTDIQHIIVEESNRQHATMLPKFYLGQWVRVSDLTSRDTLSTLQQPVTSEDLSGDPPGFVLFVDDKNLERRVNKLKQQYPGLVFETAVRPGLVDEILFRLNPLNSNQKIFIYRNRAEIPATH